MEGSKLAAAILGEVRRAVVGKDEVLAKVLLAILAGGHILLEDIPGVGKTTMALAFSKALSLRYNRVQFTPDVMPSDITGFTLYNKEAGRMEYQPGAVLCNLFLADELNRATSRTQSALLEAMEEGQVTVDGVSHPVPQPFLVIATQNPAGASGTQLLPDSQLDRFLLRLSIGYPSPADELELLRRRQYGQAMDPVRRVLGREDLEHLRGKVDLVHISDEVLQYIVRLVNATRSHPQLSQGASPRATLAVAAASRAVAFLRGRDYVVPEDVQCIWRDVIAHRLILAPGVVRQAKFPGEETYLGRGVSYCATCDGMLYRNKPVAVVGRSKDAPHEAAYLKSIGCQVVYVAPKRPEELEEDIPFIQAAKLAVKGEQTVTALEADGADIPVNGVFILREAVAPGDLLPGLTLEKGAIQVDRNMATSVPGVFAAGDATGAPLQVSKAVGEGLIAALSACEYLDRNGSK